MSHQNENSDVMHASNNVDGLCTQLIGINTIIGTNVYSKNDENLGDIQEIMLDSSSGKVCYVILSYGGFLGMGEKLIAIPWQALILDIENKRSVLNVDSKKLDSAPGFDKDNWPNMADETWANSVHSYYGTDMKRSSSQHSAM